MKYETEKLLDVYRKYGIIILGCDFDDTIFPLTDNSYIRNRCEKVIELIISLRSVMKLCLYTTTNPQELKYKVHIMKNTMKLYPDYINESPIDFGGNAKPYFNILLDDKAGLNEAIEILEEFKKNYIKRI
tara:strand:- start:33 stop:422 length:390 start_codon:yes stop_codon:yes gene_type:complete